MTSLRLFIGIYFTFYDNSRRSIKITLVIDDVFLEIVDNRKDIPILWKLFLIMDENSEIEFINVQQLSVKIGYFYTHVMRTLRSLEKRGVITFVHNKKIKINYVRKE